jgi:hypothetical protein
MKLHEWAVSERGSAFLNGVVVGSWITTVFFIYIVHVQPLILR